MPFSPKSIDSKALHSGESRRYAPPARPVSAAPVVSGIIPSIGYVYDDTAHLDSALGGDPDLYVYGRYGNPTVAAFEDAVVELECHDMPDQAAGHFALATGSGMAAIHLAMSACGLHSGATVAAAQDCYGATYSLVDSLWPQYGVKGLFVDATDLDAVERLLAREAPVLLIVETISNPLLKVVDVPRLAQLCRAHNGRPIKMTLPGPFTLSQVSVDAHYGDEEAVVMALAEIVREEVRDLFAAGADIVQLDEPWMQARPEKAKRLAVPAIDHALRDAAGPTIVHLCFGYAYAVKEKPTGYSFLPELDACAADQISIEAAQPKLDLSILETLPSKQIMVGVIYLADPAAETAETVAGRLRRALDVLPPERIVAAPDCGMKYLDPAVARAKLQALVDGAAIVRRELGG